MPLSQAVFYEQEMTLALEKLRLHPTIQDVNYFVKKLDLDGDGKISFHEFKQVQMENLLYFNYLHVFVLKFQRSTNVC